MSASSDDEGSAVGLRYQLIIVRASYALDLTWQRQAHLFAKRLDSSVITAVVMSHGSDMHCTRNSQQLQIGGKFHFIFQALTQTLATVPLHNYPKPSWSCRSSEVRDTIKAPVVLRANSISFTCESSRIASGINIFLSKLPRETKPKNAYHWLHGFVAPTLRQKSLPPEILQSYFRIRNVSVQMLLKTMQQGAAP